MTDLSHQRPKLIVQHAMETPRRLLAVGIDIAKEIHVARIVRGNGEELKERLAFGSSPDGLARAAEWMKGLGARLGADCVLAGMEPTGLYWQPVYSSLARSLPECGVYAVSPVVVKHSRYRRSSNLGKDDDRDALLIAHAVVHGECFRPIQHTPLTAQMREALWLYDRARSAERQATQHLDTMLYRAFPEAFHGVGTDAEDGIRRLLEDSAAPSMTARVPEDQWVAAHVRRGKSRRSLRAFHGRAVASCNVGWIPDDLWHAAWRCAWNRWHDACGHAASAAAVIDGLVDRHPMAQPLMSIPAVASVTVAAFLAGVGDLSQYTRAAQAEKVFGLDFQRCQSGASELPPHLSRRGYSLGLHYLYLAALRLTNDEHFGLCYHRRCKARGEDGSNAVVFALVAKLVRIMFTIARTGDAFDPARAFLTAAHE